MADKDFKEPYNLFYFLGFIAVSFNSNFTCDINLDSCTKRLRGFLSINIGSSPSVFDVYFSI